MQVFEQQTVNECGVCVIASLHKHFFHVDHKIKILKEANLIDKGLSLFDFEILAKKFGIDCETYEISYEEYMSRPNNQFDVMLAGDHYSIIRKTKSGIEVYDSRNGFSVHSKMQFSQIFSGIVIFIRKGIYTHTEQKDAFVWKQPLNLKVFAVVCIWEAVFLVCSIISAKFLATIIDIGLISQNMKNIFFLTVFFLLLMVTGTLSHYFAKTYAQKEINDSSLQMIHKLGEKMKAKNNSFKNKSDFATFSSLEYGVMSMCNFSIYEAPILLTNVFLLMTLIILFSFINVMLVSILLSFSVLFFIVSYAERKIKIKYIKKGVLSSGNTTKIISKYLDVERTSHYDLSHINYVKNYKENAKINLQLHNNNVVFSNGINLGIGILEICFSMLLTYIAVLFSFNDMATFPVSKIVYMVSLGTLFCTSLLKCCDFYLKHGEYKRFEEMAKRFYELENISFSNEVVLGEVRTMNFDKLRIQNGMFIKNKTLCDSLNGSFFNHEILINGIPYAKYECFFDRLIFVKKESVPEQQLLLDAFSSEATTIKKAVTTFNLSFGDNLQNPFVKILSLLSFKNRIIFMEDMLNALSTKEKKFVIRNVLPRIKENNFFCVVSQ